MNHLTKVFIWTSVVTVLAAGSIWLYNQYTKFLDYTISLATSPFALRKLTKDTISFVLKVNFLNKSKIEVEILGYDIDISVNNRKIATLKNSISKKIAANETSEIALDVDASIKELFNMKEALKLADNYLTDQSKIVIDVKGDISANVGKTLTIGASKLPIELSYTLKELLEKE